MNRISIAAALTAAAYLSTGCANMTDEQRAALGGAIVGGLAVAGAVAASRPTYYAPPPRVYVAPPRSTTCQRFGNTVHCNSW